jgi:hypothetical protein
MIMHDKLGRKWFPILSYTSLQEHLVNWAPGQEPHFDTLEYQAEIPPHRVTALWKEFCFVESFRVLLRNTNYFCDTQSQNIIF